MQAKFQVRRNIHHSTGVVAVEPMTYRVSTKSVLTLGGDKGYPTSESDLTENPEQVRSMKRNKSAVAHLPPVGPGVGIPPLPTEIPTTPGWRLMSRVLVMLWSRSLVMFWNRLLGMLWSRLLDMLWITALPLETARRVQLGSWSFINSF